VQFGKDGEEDTRWFLTEVLQDEGSNSSGAAWPNHVSCANGVCAAEWKPTKRAIVVSTSSEADTHAA
jgi:hypothetical protein